MSSNDTYTNLKNLYNQWATQQKLAQAKPFKRGDILIEIDELSNRQIIGRFAIFDEYFTEKEISEFRDISGRPISNTDCSMLHPDCDSNLRWVTPSDCIVPGAINWSTSLCGWKGYYSRSSDYRLITDDELNALPDIARSALLDRSAKMRSTPDINVGDLIVVQVGNNSITVGILHEHISDEKNGMVFALNDDDTIELITRKNEVAVMCITTDTVTNSNNMSAEVDNLRLIVIPYYLIEKLTDDNAHTVTYGKQNTQCNCPGCKAKRNMLEKLGLKESDIPSLSEIAEAIAQGNGANIEERMRILNKILSQEEDNDDDDIDINTRCSSNHRIQ